MWRKRVVKKKRKLKMIERKFVNQKIKEFEILEFVRDNLKNVGLSHIKMQRTPLGEKIIVYSSRPGLVVGRKGQNIRQLTKTLKDEFKLENPQIEINEVENVNLNANILAERIVDSLEKFGTTKFKGIGHKIMSDAMESGARGIEIVISGKVPSSRAKSWRFYSGYIKKCGDPALVNVDVAYAVAKLKTGVIGVKVLVMPPDVKLPDDISVVEEKTEEEKEPKKEEKKEEAKTNNKEKEKSKEAKKDTKKTKQNKKENKE